MSLSSIRFFVCKNRNQDISKLYKSCPTDNLHFYKKRWGYFVFFLTLTRCLYLVFTSWIYFTVAFINGLPAGFQSHHFLILHLCQHLSYLLFDTRFDLFLLNEGYTLHSQ